MNETRNNRSGIKRFLYRTFMDPVLWYLVLIMMALMFHYRDRVKVDSYGFVSAAGWGVLSLVMGWGMFRIFDFMQKHNLIGGLFYFLMVAAFGVAVRYVTFIGLRNYPISWMLWFLTPQESVDYNIWYTIGFFLLFQLFMGSVIYYFTRVRYRIFMNFLIFIIPFAVFGKEYEKMPTVYIVLLTVGYVLLMVYYRQLKDTDDTIFVERRRSWKTISVYAVIFAAAAALIPKPSVTADRRVLETLINADAFTDRLVAMLNVFTDTTSGERFRGNTVDVLVFEVKAQDDLHIKMSTHSTYNYDTDEWEMKDLDNYYVRHETSKLPINIGSRRGLVDAFMKAASLDKSYADKYGLTKYLNEKLLAPEIHQVTLYCTVGNVGLSDVTDMAPVPQGALTLDKTSHRDDMALLRGGTVCSVNSKFNNTATFVFSYVPDTFFLSPKNAELVDELAGYDYQKLLDDTYDVLLKGNAESRFDDADARAFDYLEIDSKLYGQYCDVLLDYGNKDRIRKLAEEITAGARTEYEKAKKLEIYLYDNDYHYDLTYKKSKGENVEDFLFDTKTGVCYEYATAMVLLARSVGIPARYCEGYSMTERVDRGYIHEDANYTISTKDAHGYPELYIKGYGWMDFEPTMTDIVPVQQKSTATDMLSRAGLIILAGAMLVLLFVFIYPWLSHKLFVMMSRKRSPKDTVTAIMRRICKLYDIEDVNTSQEACSLVHETSGADISVTAELFERAVYGEENLDITERERALEEYIRAYDAFRETKKRRRRIKT
ncbi:MAG: transglutaminase domain-containing protein [Ruminococcus sp.]|nr:transglutaminase domain-containing protein [Ruminococcus sp.]